MHIESIMMLIPAIQVGIAAAAVALSGYMLVSRLYTRFFCKTCN